MRVTPTLRKALPAAPDNQPYQSVCHSPSCPQPSGTCGRQRFSVRVDFRRRPPECHDSLEKGWSAKHAPALVLGPARHTRGGARVRGRSQVEVRQGRVHRPGAPAEPASDGPQDQREGAEQGTSRDSFRRRVGGLGGLLLGLVHRLTILLLILLNLSARLILRNVLRAG